MLNNSNCSTEVDYFDIVWDATDRERHVLRTLFKFILCWSCSYLQWAEFAKLCEALRTKAVKASKLRQVVITTRLHGEDREKISKEARRIDARFVVVHRARRWKETRVWQQSLQDRQKFWTRASREGWFYWETLRIRQCSQHRAGHQLATGWML
jgi:hypothetical protein